MQRSVPLRRFTPLRRISLRRSQELAIYWPRRELFLARHPYCQLWLAEHGMAEAEASAFEGWVIVGGRLWRVPRSRQVHHRDKRRGNRLLDETEWMAISPAGHDRLENHKTWARASGYLRAF